jgi:N-methylhydantoinase A/oxoprolinase/acetone carboxylase beta subunit
MRLIGVDVGGTFTDIVFTDTEAGTTYTYKTPTTALNPTEGVVTGIDELCRRNGVDPSGVDHVFHGTTIATNAVLEHDGAVTGMITNEGFRDLLHIGRHQRPQNYSIMQDIPWQHRPLIRRRHRKVVRERRVPPLGEVIEPLDEQSVRAAARELRDAGVEAIAICLLFSYIDPTHEDRAKEIVLEEYPGAFVTTSSSVAPQFREFERFTTAAMNAFIGPKVRTYISDLGGELAKTGVTADLHIMGSHGGVATAGMVSEKPVLTLLSGPAAGVLGGHWTATADKARQNLITFDIGGTSADIGLIVDGGFSEATARDTWIGGFPVLVPMIDITTIGAGGGSIAHVDGGGAFRVGPRSAGSLPGPACYGRGGTEPTVSDANIVLGRLDAGNFLGGEMTLDEAAARSVIAALAAELGISDIEAAEGVLTILNANMANAIRSRTIQKGLDPRDFTLVAFGGAGPLHGAEVAAALDIPEVVIPPHPGITSASGLLTTDLKYDLLKTAFQISSRVDLDRMNSDFSGLETSLMAQYAADGLQADEIEVQRAGDLRYVGQGYELRVAVPGGKLDDAAMDGVWQAFTAQHEAEYGHAFPDNDIEIVNIRITGAGRMPKIGRPEIAGSDAAGEALVRLGSCTFRVGDELREFETGFYRRDALALGAVVEGPAVILQHDTTTVVPPDWLAEVVTGGNMVLGRGGRS